jgi:Fe-S cluster assembly ATPase SufC
MIRRAYIIGTVAVGLALATLQGSPAFVSSARHFEQCFRDIQGTSTTLSPMERVVFGLILANTNPQQTQGVSVAPRT